MGIMDGPWGVFNAASDYGKTRYKEEQLAGQQAQIEALLKAAATPGVMPEGQMGPPTAAPGLGSVLPQIANVMGSPQLMASAAQDEANMQRTRYLNDNPSQAEQNRLAEMQRQWDEADPARKAQIKASEAETFYKSVMAQQAQQKALENPLYPTLGPGSKMFDEHYKEGLASVNALQDLDNLERAWTEAGKVPFLLGREQMAKAEPYVQKIIGYMGKTGGTGALQEADQKRFLDALQKPGVFTNSSFMRAAFSSIRDQMGRDLESVNARNPFVSQYLTPPMPAGAKVVKVPTNKAGRPLFETGPKGY